MRVWVDVDNAPQVQYLVPLAQAFERAGAELILTARDQGITLDLMRTRDVPFHPVGSAFSRSKVSKATGLLRRSVSLSRLLAGSRPTLLVSASRSSAAAARRMRVPTFIVVDYEFVHLGIYRRLGANLLFPDVIEAEVFLHQGFSESRLMPFHGIKEDISFLGQDVAGIAPHPLPGDNKGLVRVLFRPPAEESHYHREETSRIAQELLRELASNPHVVVVFSPRYTWQLDDIGSQPWINEPILLREAIPFLPLLKSVDLVVSAGGTMLREAAYLGTPAYSLFQGSPGAVDRYLETAGRLAFIRQKEDFRLIRLEKSTGQTPLQPQPGGYR